MRYVNQLRSIVLMASLMIGAWPSPSDALQVTQLDFTSGAVNWDWRYGRVLDRLFAQDGSITMGSYQSMSDIVGPITPGRKTFSLFTSGFNGAPAPSATINGTSMTVDLSSLYFGWTRGGEMHAWNIGGIAKGLFNPETLEFCLTWDHLFRDRPTSDLPTYFLQGKVILAGLPIGSVPVGAVPITTTAVLFGTGLAMLMAVWRRKGVTQHGQAVPSS